MFDFTLQQLLLRLASLLLIAAAHGYVLALVARFLGDRGPDYDGRLTLNPITHLDAIGTFTFLFFSLGWIKPVVVDSEQFHKPRRDPVILATVGLLVPLALALALRLLRPIVFTVLPDNLSFGALALINTTVSLSIWFAALNVLPLPPLTGAQFVSALYPGWLEHMRRYEIYTKLILEC